MEIEINGKKVGFLHGYSAFKDFYLGMIDSPEKYQSQSGELTRYAIAQICFAAYENWRTDLRRSRELSFDDLYEWVDNSSLTEDGMKIISIIADEWGKSKHVQKLVEESQKKSQVEQTESTSTKLNQSVSES